MTIGKHALPIRSLIAIALATTALGVLSPAKSQAAPETAASVPPAARALVQSANDAIRKGDLRVATLLLKNAIQAAPRDAALRAQLGTILAMQGQMPEAERTLREARSQGAPDAAVLPALFQAMLSRREGQNLLDQFAEPAANNNSQLAAETLRARALAFFSLNNVAAADSEIDKALAIHRSAPALLNKAQFATARRDNDLAGKLVDEALVMAPKDLAVLVMKIGLLERRDALPDALTYSDRLVAAYPDQALPKILRVELLARLGQGAKAEADVNWLLKASPNMPIALYDRALLRARKGDVKGAWQIAQALPPDFLRSEPQFALGAAQMAQAAGNAELGDSLLTSVVANFPDNLEARLLLAAKRLEQKNPKQALDYLEPVKASNDPRVMALLAQAYQATGQGALADTYLAKAKQASLRPTPDALDRLAVLNAKSPANPDAADALVQGLVQSGRAKDALAVANQFSRAAPGNPMGNYLRGESLMASGDLDGAATALTAMLKAKPGFAPALFYRSQVAAARGDLAAANADLDAVLAKDPSNVQALSKKAQYAMQAGRDSDAEALFKRAAAASPKDATPQLALAAFYTARKDYAKAQAVIAATQRQWPSDPRAGESLVLIQLEQGAVAQAKNTASQLARQSPNSPEVQLLLANVLDRAKDPGALATFQSAVRISDDSLAANQALVNHFVASGEKAKAVDAASGFAGRRPGVDSDLLLADTLLKTGDQAGAKSALENAMRQRPDNRTVLALARLEALTDQKSAEQTLTGWLSNHADDATALEQQASLLTAEGNQAAAQKTLEQLLKLQPYNAMALNDLAWSLQKSDPARAVQLASMAARIAPRSGEILDTLAWLKWQQNNRAQGLDLLRQAHQLSPNEPNIAYHLAVAQHDTGDRAGAMATLRTILKTNPGGANKAQIQKLEAAWR